MGFVGDETDQEYFYVFFSSYHMPVIGKVQKNSRIRYKSTPSMQMKETAKEKKKQVSNEFTDG